MDQSIFHQGGCENSAYRDWQVCASQKLSDRDLSRSCVRYSAQIYSPGVFKDLSIGCWWIWSGVGRFVSPLESTNPAVLLWSFHCLDLTWPSLVRLMTESVASWCWKGCDFLCQSSLPNWNPFGQALNRLRCLFPSGCGCNAQETEIIRYPIYHNII